MLSLLCKLPARFHVYLDLELILKCVTILLGDAKQSMMSQYNDNLSKNVLKDLKKDSNLYVGVSTLLISFVIINNKITPQPQEFGNLGRNTYVDNNVISGIFNRATDSSTTLQKCLRLNPFLFNLCNSTVYW